RGHGRVPREPLSPARGGDRGPTARPHLRLGRGARPHAREVHGRARRVPLAAPGLEHPGSLLRRRRPPHPARCDAAPGRSAAVKPIAGSVLVTVALVLSVVAAGAAAQEPAPKTTPSPSTPRPAPPRECGEEYRVGSGDTLEVVVFGNDD